MNNFQNRVKMMFGNPLHNAFWKAMGILTELERSPSQIQDDVQSWVDTVVNTPIDESTLTKREKLRRAEKVDKISRQFLELAKKVPKVECSFCHPHVRSRLEKLMGTNVVNLTDREYMQKLQQRILEDYSDSMAKRIKNREEAELGRVKNLVLSGVIPLEKAPPEMADHPVVLLEGPIRRTIKNRAKTPKRRKKAKGVIYGEDTPDSQTQLSISNISLKDEEEKHKKYCFFSTGVFSTEDTDEHFEIPKEYDRLRYESPLIKELRSAQSVDELYSLADQIVGKVKQYGKDINKKPSQSVVVADISS